MFDFLHLLCPCSCEPENHNTFKYYPAGSIVRRCRCENIQSWQMRNTRLQGIQAIIGRQQRISPKGNNRYCFADWHRRALFLRPHWRIVRAFSLTPFRHRLWVDLMLVRQGIQARLTMLCHRRTAFVVQAQSCGTCPIASSSVFDCRLDQYTVGLNIWGVADAAGSVTRA